MKRTIAFFWFLFNLDKLYWCTFVNFVILKLSNPSQVTIIQSGFFFFFYLISSTCNMFDLKVYMKNILIQYLFWINLYLEIPVQKLKLDKTLLYNLISLITCIYHIYLTNEKIIIWGKFMAFNIRNHGIQHQTIILTCTIFSHRSFMIIIVHILN